MDTVISAYQILDTVLKRIAQNPVYVGLWTKVICGLKGEAIILSFFVYADKISSLNFINIFNNGIGNWRIILKYVCCRSLSLKIIFL